MSNSRSQIIDKGIRLRLVIMEKSTHLDSNRFDAMGRILLNGADSSPQLDVPRYNCCRLSGNR